MKRLCVFCGSQTGKDDIYRHVATILGGLFAQRGYGLVYGGGQRGLMGVIATAVMERGGEVFGVIPEAMVEREWANTGITELFVEASMHARKARMAELADAFIAMPGGYGTLEELFEIITWAQLGIHRKPIGLLNVSGYFDALLALVDRAITDGFISPEHRDFIISSAEPVALLDMIEQHTMPSVPVWPGTTKDM